jgi:uncharacterized protein HemX
MSWFSIRKSTTRDLVRADYDLLARRNGLLFIWVLAIALAAVIALGTVYVVRYLGDGRAQQQLAAVLQENQTLRETLTQNTLKMQQDQAARSELEQQLAKSSATIKELQETLTFYQQQTRK